MRAKRILQDRPSASTKRTAKAPRRLDHQLAPIQNHLDRIGYKLADLLVGHVTVRPDYDAEPTARDLIALGPRPVEPHAWHIWSALAFLHRARLHLNTASAIYTDEEPQQIPLPPVI